MDNIWKHYSLTISTLSLIYSIGLGIFRHNVFEDLGFIDSCRDSLQYGLLCHLNYTFYELLQGVNMKAYSPYVNGLMVIINTYLLRNTFRKYVCGVEYDKTIKCDNKVYIITGCNTGIGYETAKGIVLMGGTVVMACRSIDKANQARDSIINTTHCPPDKLIVLPLDLCDFTSVRGFVKLFEGLKKPLNCLINNAGVMMENRQETKDGLEMVFTANHLSHHLLTNLLLPHLNKTNGRVVVLTSALHRLPERFNFDDVMSKNQYSLFGTYSQAKLANVMFMKELQRRLELVGSRVTCNAVHPGCVRTDVTRNMNAFMRIGNTLAAPIMWTLQKTSEQGAYSSIYAATSPELTNKGGIYLFHCSPTKVNIAALDLKDNDLLWRLSEEIVNGKKVSNDVDTKKKK